MANAYQHDANGYFAGAFEDYGLLPNNACYTSPELKEGFIPRWNGEVWEQVENHKGKQGYLDGQPYTVKYYGPLPEGFSETPPLPTMEEAKAAKLAEILAGQASAMEPVLSAYPEAERSAWPYKVAEAEELLADSKAAAPLLRAELENLSDGTSIMDLARKVLEKNLVYKQISGALNGQKRRFVKELEELSSSEDVTVEQIMQFSFEYSLPDLSQANAITSGPSSLNFIKKLWR